MIGRRRLWEILSVAKPGDTASTVLDRSIVLLILLNVVAIALESVVSLREQFGSVFRWFEIVSVAVFSTEYLARAATCTADDKSAKGLKGVALWVVEPLSIIDLVAILPFFLPFFPIDLRFIRVFRVLRTLRIAKLGCYSNSLAMMGRVFKKRKEDLLVTTLVMLFMVYCAACIMYHFENPVQPEVFSSIPATLWWAVVTLTTVGYGDVYPVTTMGRILSGVFAILAIGLVALPTGILSIAYVEEMRKKPQKCPHCGKAIDEGNDHGGE